MSHKAEEFNLEAFWKLESLGIDSSKNQEKKSDYLSNYQDSSIEFRGDKYYAKLPWKQIAMNYRQITVSLKGEQKTSSDGWGQIQIC